MIPQKVLVPYYIWVFAFTGLITLGWTWLYFVNGMLCFFGNVIGIIGLILSMDCLYQKGMEDKSVEIANQQVRIFWENAHKQHYKLKRKIPSVHRHLRLVAK